MGQPLSNDNCRCKKELGTFQPNSTYGKNVKTALTTVVNETTKEKSPEEKGFSVEIIDDGNKEDRVIAIALCAPWLTPNDCLSCVNNTLAPLQQKCPNHKKAAAWGHTCLVRYEPFSLGSYDPWFVAHEISEEKVKDVKGLEKALSELFLNVTDEAIEGDILPVLYAFGTKLYGSPSQHLFMSAQCSLDISGSAECDDCFNLIYKEMKPSGASAVAIFTPICYMRYAHHDFRKPK
ncbi:hypothetical protein QVD17_17967 [Tagetes erecta]|uniref:Gnk2-homologous domain-containing protein n=1 Tax=Tagetes erecta TaxID=13708 RepID=A0AAD8KKB0_TARER|nr:hypothetical protein QVD17_17967 [Tagetes erecta]